MFQVCKTLKPLLKPELQKLNIDCYGDINKRVKEVQKELDDVQQLLMQHSSGLLIKEAELAKKYTSLRNSKQAFCRQKSRISWISLGHQNSHFY